MKRSILALILAVSAAAAHAEPGSPNAGFVPNDPRPANLSAVAEAEVRALIGNQDLNNLTSAQVGAIESLLGAADIDGVAAQIERIVVGGSASNAPLSAEAWNDDDRG